MIVKYKIKDTKHKLIVEYDNSQNVILNHDNYNTITQREVNKYCEYYNKDKILSIEDYKSHVDIIREIYKEVISEKGLLKIAKEMPKQKNGMFKQSRQLLIAKSLNAIPTEKGYRCSALIAYVKDRYTIEIKYIDSCFAF